MPDHANLIAVFDVRKMVRAVSTQRPEVLTKEA